MYRSASPLTFKQRVHALHYPLYVTLIALLATVTAVRLLSDYTWRESALYGGTLVLSFWLGQFIMGLMHKTEQGDRA